MRNIIILNTADPHNLLCVTRNNYFVPLCIKKLFHVPLFPSHNGVEIYQCRGLPSEMRNFIILSTAVPHNLLCVTRNNYFVPLCIKKLYLGPLFPSHNGVKIYQCRGLPSEMRNFIILRRP